MSERVKGAEGVSLVFRLTDSATGAAKAGVDVTTLKLQWWRPGAAPSVATALTLLALATTAWTAFGAREVDAVNSKGVYRVDCPDAGFAGGADEVELSVSGPGIETSTRLIDLTNFDARNGTNGALTALPPANANAAGGLPVSIAGGLDMDELNVDEEAMAAQVLALFKADLDWQAMLAGVNGQFLFNPGTGVLVLKDKANVTTLATLTLTKDINGNILLRTSA